MFIILYFRGPLSYIVRFPQLVSKYLSLKQSTFNVVTVNVKRNLPLFIKKVNTSFVFSTDTSENNYRKLSVSIWKWRIR